jgi:hypothetical protein
MRGFVSWRGTPPGTLATVVLELRPPCRRALPRWLVYRPRSLHPEDFARQSSRHSSGVSVGPPWASWSPRKRWKDSSSLMTSVTFRPVQSPCHHQVSSGSYEGQFTAARPPRPGRPTASPRWRRPGDAESVPHGGRSHHPRSRPCSSGPGGWNRESRSVMARGGVRSGAGGGTRWERPRPGVAGGRNGSDRSAPDRSGPAGANVQPSGGAGAQETLPAGKEKRHQFHPNFTPEKRSDTNFTPNFTPAPHAALGRGQAIGIPRLPPAWYAARRR